MRQRNRYDQNTVASDFLKLSATPTFLKKHYMTTFVSYYNFSLSSIENRILLFDSNFLFFLSRAETLACQIMRWNGWVIGLVAE